MCNRPFQLSRCLDAQEVWLLTNDDKVQNVGSAYYSMDWFGDCQDFLSNDILLHFIS